MLVKRKIDPGCQKSIFYQENVFFCLHDRQCKCLFELSTVTIFLLFTVETYCTQQNIIWALQFHDCFPADVMRKQADCDILAECSSSRLRKLILADSPSPANTPLTSLRIRPPLPPLSCQIWTKPSDLRFDTPMSRIIFLRGEFQQINNTSRSAGKIVMTYKKDAR